MPAQQLLYSGDRKVSTSKARFTPIQFNPSSQHLMKVEEHRPAIITSSSSTSKCSSSSPHHVSRSQWHTVLVLFFVNLINYMDRMTVAGVLSQVQVDYGIGDGQAGALQTAFVVSYMVFAPIFGYLGDRKSRKLIMAIGVFTWTVFTIIGSFMPTYEWFLICRAMVGVGEASYSTIAPTIISDMFVKDVRSKMLAFFYFAIPVGSGLGYVVGAETAKLAGGDWRWGLRVTPILGLLAVFLILCCMVDPPRGESEGHGDLKATSYAKDLRSLAKNKSFVFSTIAFTCVAFCTGALSWWGPNFIEAAARASSIDDDAVIGVGNIALVFGFITMLSGIVGVPLGSILSTKLKQRYSQRVDPIICGCGLVLSSALLGAAMFIVEGNISLAFLLLFLGEVALNLNWSIVADILLYVVVPTRRSSAEAVQILISHALGDAGSPYLIGVVSDCLRIQLPREQICSASSLVCDSLINFFSMQYSLLINNVVELLGGGFFFITAIYIVRDKMKCDRYIAEQENVETRNLDAYPSTVFRGESESFSDDDDDEEVPQLQQPIFPDSHQV